MNENSKRYELSKEDTIEFLTGIFPKMNPEKYLAEQKEGKSHFFLFSVKTKNNNHVILQIFKGGMTIKATFKALDKGEEIEGKYRFSSKSGLMKLAPQIREAYMMFNRKVNPVEQQSAKAEKKPREKKQGKIFQLISFASPLIEDGIEKKELLRKLIEQFPETAEGTFKVQLSTAKRQPTFGKLLVEIDGKITFAKN